MPGTPRVPQVLTAALPQVRNWGEQDCVPILLHRTCLHEFYDPLGHFTQGLVPAGVRRRLQAGSQSRTLRRRKIIGRLKSALHGGANRCFIDAPR